MRKRFENKADIFKCVETLRAMACEIFVKRELHFFAFLFGPGCEIFASRGMSEAENAWREKWPSTNNCSTGTSPGSTTGSKKTIFST
jgi:hypothetical protein